MVKFLILYINMCYLFVCFKCVDLPTRRQPDMTDIPDIPVIPVMPDIPDIPIYRYTDMPNCGIVHFGQINFQRCFWCFGYT